MVGCHHRFRGHELGQTLGGGEGQGSLVCRSPWGSQRVGHDLATEQERISTSPGPVGVTGEFYQTFRE